MIYPELNVVKSLLDDLKPGLAAIESPTHIWTPEAGFDVSLLNNYPVFKDAAEWVAEGVVIPNSEKYRLTYITACLGTTTAKQIVPYPHCDPVIRFTFNAVGTDTTTNPSTLLFTALDNDFDFHKHTLARTPVVDLPEAMRNVALDAQAPEGSLVYLGRSECHAEAPLKPDTAKLFIVATITKQY